MRFPTVIIEGKNLPRVILSITSPSSPGPQEILSLMRRAFEMGVWCFDLPTPRHHQSFKELKGLTEEETLHGPSSHRGRRRRLPLGNSSS